MDLQLLKTMYPIKVTTIAFSFASLISLGIFSIPFHEDQVAQEEHSDKIAGFRSYWYDLGILIQLS